MLNWDSVARRYVEHDTAAQETFGALARMTREQFDAAPLVAVDIDDPDWPFGGAGSNNELPTNDNVPVAEQPARYVGIDLAQPCSDRTAYWSSSASDNKRPGEFMQTYSGRRFYPLDPRPEEIHIEDIAHALAHLCRYGGHCQSFYSVAEHSVLMSRTFTSRTAALWALLHDAAEAYIADVPRPLKKFLPGYKEAEERVMAAVCERFGLSPKMPLEVKDADNRILADEIAQNMRPMDWHSEHQDFLGVDLQFWSPDDAESEFLLRFWDLMDGRAAA